MALEKIVRENGRAWGLWKINDAEEALEGSITDFDTIPPNITNPKKKMEWWAGRILAHRLTALFGMSYEGIFKDEFGKPFLAGSDWQLSLSHSFPYVAAIIDKKGSVGIDLEQPKEKLLKIGPRVLQKNELADAGTDVVKHCVYWCAKESLVKIYGKKDLTFAENLQINPFSLQGEGNIIGSIIVGNKETIIPLYYMVTPQFVMVFNKQSDS